MSTKKYSSAETVAIEAARKTHPKLSTRALARLIDDRCDEPVGIPLVHRTLSSIYSALRRYDAALYGGAKTLGETLPV